MDDSLLLHLSESGLITALPPRDTWRRLSAYESGDLVRQLLKERHGRSPNADKSAEVAAHVAQGRQFFEAATDAGSLTRPLLLYYGVLALSRAIVLSADVSRRECTLNGAHGLSALGWGETLAKGMDRVPEIQVTITGGTFSELAVATSNVERSLVYGYHRLRRPVLQHGAEGFDPNANQVRISLKETLARLPDLTDLYQLTFGALSACHPAYIQVHHDIQTDYYLLQTRRGLADVDHIRKAFGLHSEVSIEADDYYHPVGQVSGLKFVIHNELSPPSMRRHTLPIKNDRFGLPYVVEPLDGDQSLSTLSLLFIVSYAMGMLVRYHPSQWASLSGHGRGNGVVPLLTAAAHLIEQRFPGLVLEELEQVAQDSTLYRHPALG